MSASTKTLIVSKELVNEIPSSKMEEGKIIIPDLAEKDALEVDFVYKIKDRKPFRILRMYFNRIKFDKAGIYDQATDKVRENEQDIIMIYAMSSIGGSARNLPTPVEPTKPTNEEVNMIKDYLNRKYPQLLENDPNAMEISLFQDEELYKERLKKKGA